MPGFLLKLFIWKEPTLRHLADGLRAHRGSLRWTGVLSWPSSAWRHGLAMAFLKSLDREIFFEEHLIRAHGLLPSEERSIHRCREHLLAWLEAASSWQLIVPADPFWDESELILWRGALKRLVARSLSFLWRLSIRLSHLEATLARGLRRLSFAIDSRP